MPIAAVPAYLGKKASHFKDASPALRFGMLLELWGINRRTQEHLWTTSDIDYVVSGQHRQERAIKRDNKNAALQQAALLNPNDWAAMQALAARQTHLARAADAYSIDATAIAPFTTGLGNEHPLENGFAFLNPYGLPYLAGSGVKGVLRQAARELASGEWSGSHGWSDEKTFSIQEGQKPTLSMLDVLFGLQSQDGDTLHARGALSFWDVIPQIPGNSPSLHVEVMTPHQGHYYQGKSDGGSTTPHDSGQPVPICFLTVPPESKLCFHVQCDRAHLARLAPQLAAGDQWQKLLQAAFEHAFEWLGFGAKTAVGYGAMQTEAQRQRQAQESEIRRKAEEARHKAEEARQLEQQAETWEGARLTFNRKNGSLTVEKSGQKATAVAPDGERLLNSLPPVVQQKVRTNPFVKVTARAAKGTLFGVQV